MDMSRKEELLENLKKIAKPKEPKKEKYVPPEYVSGQKQLTPSVNTPSTSKTKVVMCLNSSL